MSEANQNLPARKPRSDIGRAHLPMTEERKQKFLAALRETGSPAESARHASPLAQDGDGCNALSTFERERRISPAFADAWADAMNEAVGRAEKELVRRMYQATERATLDKQGNVRHVSLDYRNADLLLLRFLERHRGGDWTPAQKRQIEGQITYVGHGNAPGGIGFNVTPLLTSFLDNDEKKMLSDLMRAMVERSEAAQLEQEQKRELPPPEMEKH